MKANVKLMNELLNEIKDWLLHDENSLAKTMPKLLYRIKDLEKIALKGDTDENMDIIAAINKIFSDLELFGRHYSAILHSCTTLHQAIGRMHEIGYCTELPDSFCNNEPRELMATTYDTPVALSK